jgi:hypothetical protein
MDVGEGELVVMKVLWKEAPLLGVEDIAKIEALSKALKS